MAGPKVSQQNIGQRVTASAGMPFSHSASWFPRKSTYAPGHPSDVNMIHQTRPHSPIAPWSSPDAHWAFTVAAFGSGQVSACAPCPMHNKLWYTVYSDTFSSEPALIFRAIWTTVGFYAKRCIRILGVHQAAWHTRCDDKVLLHFNVFFFFLSSWTHSMRCCTFKILRKKRTSMWRCCCLPQNWNQVTHTECIFIAFSRGTSIIIALASHTREPKAMSN